MDPRIDLSFAETAAQNLLGCHLIVESPDGRMVGRIVETEAYTDDDPSSHAYRGETPRNRSMFEGVGTIYVYFTYGMHYCMNIVTGKKGEGQAVLIRALEPLEGLEIMEANRGTKDVFNLTNGPAKLTQAFGINKSFDGLHVGKGPISLEYAPHDEDIITTTRIGIKQATDLKRRFYLANNSYVSKLG